MGKVIRRQMRASGAHHGLGPVLDICRDPRWGRVEETFGEDALLVAGFGAEYVRGLQGEELKEGVLATGKHFIAHSIPEGGLNCTPVHLGPREIRETYLLPYEAALREAGLRTMMNSYSELDGQVIAANKAILRDLLRDELGFDGLVVSDYLAIEMLHTFHRVSADLGDAAIKALHAGIALELPETNCYGQPLLAALECGEIEESLIDEAVRQVLTAKFDLGLFEQPFVPVDAVEAIYTAQDAADLAREIADQSLVLLKNDGEVLPLPKGLGTLAVIGPNADAGRCFLSDYSHASMIELLMDGTPQLKPLLQATGSQVDYDWALATIPTLLGAIRERLDPGTRVVYAPGCDIASHDTSGLAEAVAVAQAADVVILVLGDQSGLAPGFTSGEFQDRASLELAGVQIELAQAVLAAAQGRPVIAVLINGRPLSLTWLAEHATAILEAWIPGEQGAPAIADALLGVTNPGGKLAVSLPRSVGQVPVFYNHKPSGGRSNFRGDYVEQSSTPMFTFGHGLSYTRFTYSNLSVTPRLETGEVVQVSCEVRNSGARAGDEVVQLYIQDEYACLPRPVQELKGFRRVHLAPRQTVRVTFELTAAHLAYFDEAMALGVEPGQVRVMVGSSSADIRLEGSFDVAEKIQVSHRATRIQGDYQVL
jgi:beta-glucosidase